MNFDKINSLSSQAREFRWGTQSFILVDKHISPIYDVDYHLREACSSRFTKGMRALPKATEYVLALIPRKDRWSETKFYDWLINKSQMSKLFIPMTGADAYRRGGCLLKVRDVDQLLFGMAIKAVRFPQEHARVSKEVYKIFRDSGLTYPMCLTHKVDVLDDFIKIGSQRNVGHSFLGTRNTLAIALNRMKEGGRDLIENEGYIGTCDVQFAEGKEVSLDMESLTKDLPVERKEIGKCPFTGRALYSTGTLPLKETVEIVNKWFKEHYIGDV